MQWAIAPSFRLSGQLLRQRRSSTYKAFEAKLEKRFANGLQFLTHYTFSHADGYDSNYYAVDHQIAWGPVDFNRNQVFVFNTVYELPFGKGKKYMGNSGRAMDYIVGGWQSEQYHELEQRLALDSELCGMRR